MKSQRLFLSTAAALLLIGICSPQAALATTRIVNPSDSTCSDSSSTPCYTSISAALAAVTSSSDTIEIHPGTYAENITLSSAATAPATVQGTETARTILDGSGGAAILVDNVAVTIRNLSFTNASTGIQLQNSASATILNNVFQVGSGGTAIDIVDDTSSATIENNTFYNNNVAINIASSSSDISQPIENNIFSTNTTAIQSSATTTTGTIDYNLFYNSGGVVSGSNDVTSADPKFVDASIGDFQLQAGSTCIGVGDPNFSYNSIDSKRADLGAYGGSNADTYPFPVQNVGGTVDSSTQITLTWDANNSYQVAGYKVYYGTSSGSYTTTIDAGNVTSYIISGLSATASAPTGTTTLTSAASSGKLSLSWDAVSDATGYLLLYDTAGTPSLSSSTTTSVDVGNVTTYDLTGLTNGTYYYVTVTPYSAAYYFAVTAYYENTAFESAYSSEVNSDINYGTASNTLYDYPEAITGYPNLPNKGGCFIATAAYGYYSAPQVQALREFRDRYLITNGPGRAFVRWYYTYGPKGARFITEHPGLKPVVRAALLPAVAGALFLRETSFTFQLALLLIAGLALTYLFYKKRSLSPRGSH